MATYQFNAISLQLKIPESHKNSAAAAENHCQRITIRLLSKLKFSTIQCHAIPSSAIDSTNSPIRASALSGYLADIHARKHDSQELYVRRIRDLVGHGECIMGLMDSYPDDLDFITGKELAEIER